MNDVMQIHKLINEYETFAIAGHVNPDGDCIGACMAFALTLKKMLKNPIVLLEEYSEKFDIIPGRELIFKGNIDELNVDVLICLDCASIERLGNVRGLLERTKETVCIDHHLMQRYFAKYNCINPKAPSTCTMVFDLISYIVPIDEHIATALYAGLVYDTGGFRNASTSAEAHIIASKLINLDIPFTKIYDAMLRHRTLSAAKMLTVAINRIQFNEQTGVYYSYTTTDDLKEQNASHKDLGEIVSYILAIDNAEVSVFAYEKEQGKVKVSMRSKEFNVHNVALKFGGGGHKLASGCDFEGSVSDALEKVLAEINNSIDSPAENGK